MKLFFNEEKEKLNLLIKPGAPDGSTKKKLSFLLLLLT